MKEKEPKLKLNNVIFFMLGVLFTFLILYLKGFGDVDTDMMDRFEERLDYYTGEGLSIETVNHLGGTVNVNENTTLGYFKMVYYYPKIPRELMRGLAYKEIGYICGVSK